MGGSQCRRIQIPASGQFGGLMLEAAHYYTEDSVGRTMVTTNFLALKLAEQGLDVATIDSFTASTANRARVNVVPITPEIKVEVKALHRFQDKLSHSATGFIKTLAAVAQASVARSCFVKARSRALSPSGIRHSDLMEIVGPDFWHCMSAKSHEISERTFFPYREPQQKNRL
jgi:hypothetical protein